MFTKAFQNPGFLCLKALLLRKNYVPLRLIISVKNIPKTSDSRNYSTSVTTLKNELLRSVSKLHKV